MRNGLHTALELSFGALRLVVRLLPVWGAWIWLLYWVGVGLPWPWLGLPLALAAFFVANFVVTVLTVLEEYLHWALDGGGTHASYGEMLKLSLKPTTELERRLARQGE